MNVNGINVIVGQDAGLAKWQTVGKDIQVLTDDALLHGQPS